MTILTVRGGPVRSCQVQKTVRMRGGRCNTHRATQNQRGLHRSRLVPTARCICRGAGPSAALWQTHEPDDTPAKGRLPTSEPLNVPWWSDSLATPAGSLDAEARAASHGYKAACNCRRVFQIRRYTPPASMCHRNRGGELGCGPKFPDLRPASNHVAD